jgi:putative redox protein
VVGTRRETEPRRYIAIAFHFTVRGEGADETKVRRAIDLSLEKYCSVVASLAPDISISYDVTVA